MSNLTLDETIAAIKALPTSSEIRALACDKFSNTQLIIGPDISDEDLAVHILTQYGKAKPPADMIQIFMSVCACYAASTTKENASLFLLETLHSLLETYYLGFYRKLHPQSTF